MTPWNYLLNKNGWTTIVFRLNIKYQDPHAMVNKRNPSSYQIL